LKSAIKSAAVSKLRELPPAELSQFTHDLGTILYYWFGELTEKRILELRRTVSSLNELIDFQIVLGHCAILSTAINSFILDPVVGH
jgi:hypothetical protein